MSDLNVSVIVLWLAGGFSGIFISKGDFCFVISAHSWGVSGVIELSHVDVRSSPLEFGILAISILSPVSSSSVACSIPFSFASATAIFLSALVRVFARSRLRISCARVPFRRFAS